MAKMTRGSLICEKCGTLLLFRKVCPFCGQDRYDPNKNVYEEIEELREEVEELEEELEDLKEEYQYMLEEILEDYEDVLNGYMSREAFLMIYSGEKGKEIEEIVAKVKNIKESEGHDKL